MYVEKTLFNLELEKHISSVVSEACSTGIKPTCSYPSVTALCVGPLFTVNPYWFIPWIPTCGALSTAAGSELPQV